MKDRNRKLYRRLQPTLIAAALALAWAPGAHAAMGCTGIAPLDLSSGETLTCDSLSITDAGTTVVVQNGSKLDVTHGVQLHTTGDGAHGVLAGINGTVHFHTAEGQTAITTTGNDAHGIEATAHATVNVTSSGDSLVTTTGDGAIGVYVHAGSTSALGGGSLAGASVGLGASAVVLADPPNPDVFAVIDGGSAITTTGAGSHGVYAETATGAATVRQLSGSIATTGEGADGIGVNAGQDVTVEMNGGGAIATSGDQANGVHARSMNGATTVQQLNGRIKTEGQESTGIMAFAKKDAAVDIDGGSTVATTGEDSVGVFAVSTDGGASVRQLNGRITTGGASAPGIIASASEDAHVEIKGGSTIHTKGAKAYGVQAASSTGKATVRQLNGAITTEGQSSEGIWAQAHEDAAVEISGGSTIATKGDLSYGVYAVSDDGTSTVRQLNGGITTEGVSAHGIVASAGNDVQVDVDGSSTIHTQDESSNGVYAYTNGGNATVRQLSGTVTTDKKYADGIAAFADSGTATVEARGTVSAYGDGIRAAGKEVAVTVRGTVESTGTDTTLGDRDGVVVFTGGDSTVTNTGTIKSATGHGINLMYANGVNTINSNGEITAVGNTVADSSGQSTFAIYGGAGKDQVYIGGGTIRGNVHLGRGEDYLSMSHATMDGGIYMGPQDDRVVFNAGNDLSHLTALDGEGPAQGIYDDGGAGDTRGKNELYLVTAELTGSTHGAGVGVAGNTAIANWDYISIGAATADPFVNRLNLTGDIDDGRGEGSLGQMEIGLKSVFALAPGTSSARVDYHVASKGTIDLTPGHSTMTVAGNYQGAPGSKLLVKSAWNNPDVQTSDHLIIEGNATGETAVSVPGGIIGNVTLADAPKNGGLLAPVVTVQGTDAGTQPTGLVFAGTADTGNAGQAQLAKNGDSYYWTLMAREPGDPGDPNNPGRPNEPGTPNHPGTSEDGHLDELPDTGSVPILQPGVSGYVQMPRINREMGFAQLGSLHERVGEQQTWAWDECGKLCGEYRELVAAGKRPHPFWGRIVADSLKEQGKSRLGYKSTTALVQLGTDLAVITDEARNHQHLGVMGSYSHGWHDFYDKGRSVGGVIQPDKYVGEGRSDMLSAGAYSTWYRANGTYLDLVGNVSWLHNKYDSASGRASQDGWGLGLSAEVGRPWKLGQSAWQIEPQAQLMYQYAHLGSFEDASSRIHGQNGGTLRGRLGARLAWNAGTPELRTKTFYLTANVLSDLTGIKSKAKVGADTVRERYARTWGEVGVGAQVPLAKSTYLYGDLRYSRALGGYRNAVYRSTGLARESYGARIGLRHTW